MTLRFGLTARLATATALLVVTIVAVVVWQWTASERRLVREQKRAEARALATAMADLLMNELDDENWGQIRVSTELLLTKNPDVVYVLLHDHRKDDRVVAAAPADAEGAFVPDLVPLAVTRGAVAATTTRTEETWLLRAVAVGTTPRAARGERIAEVASPVTTASGVTIGSLRVGVSLVAVDRAVAAAVRKALLIGALALVFGVAFAGTLAWAVVQGARLGLQGRAVAGCLEVLAHRLVDRLLHRLAQHRLAEHLLHQGGGRLALAKALHLEVLAGFLELLVDLALELGGGHRDRIAPLQALVQGLGDLHRACPRLFVLGDRSPPEIAAGRHGQPPDGQVEPHAFRGAYTLPAARPSSGFAARTRAVSGTGRGAGGGTRTPKALADGT